MSASFAQFHANSSRERDRTGAPRDADRQSEHFVIEADRAVVGVAVRVPGGFQFFTSDEDFRSLEGRVFPRARGLVHGATQLASRLRKRRPRQAAEAGDARR